MRTPTPQWAKNKHELHMICVTIDIVEEFVIIDVERTDEG
jgi:hypothetical protein